MHEKKDFWQSFAGLLALGLIGVLTLPIAILPSLTLVQQTQPELVTLPIPLLVALSMIQPIILLAIAVAIGCLLAPRTGLVSLLAKKMIQRTHIWLRLRRDIPLSAALGLLLAALITLLDRLFLPFMGAEFQSLVSAEGNPYLQLVLGLLYGGITEELLLRWGLMSLFVWLGCLVANRILKQSTPVCQPTPVVAWSAIVLAAILFGLGHLPALAASVTLTTPIILRTVLLNMLGGLIFGWLFWRKNLESAMIAHAMTHVGFFIIGLIF
ncbi:MAG: CPBP family intramembrane metalloprotease [Eubacteriales bacterium]|nr:CPBP family intramembrane metalloprotease [Eubacteriales bacterium]